MMHWSLELIPLSENNTLTSNNASWVNRRRAIRSRKSLREEETHWNEGDSFGHGLTLEKLATADFNQILGISNQYDGS